MPYSTIQRKHCSCSENCDKWPTMGCKGKNYNCLTDEEKEVIGNRKKVAIKNRNNRNSQLLKLRKVQNEMEGSDKQKLELWFKLKMNTCEKVCENCGANLQNYNEWSWRGSQHHIIEKSEINGCPSVACNPNNHGVLGYWCCHSQWHVSQEKAMKMPFFKIARERFELFKNDIVETNKIPQMFLSQS